MTWKAWCLLSACSLDKPLDLATEYARCTPHVIKRSLRERVLGTSKGRWYIPQVSHAQRRSFSPCINNSCLVTLSTLERFTVVQSQKLGEKNLVLAPDASKLNLLASTSRTCKQQKPAPWRRQLGGFRNGGKTSANGDTTRTTLTENNWYL